MKNRTRSIFTIAAASFTIAAGPAPEPWNVDIPHTGIDFSVKHFFTPVQGSFEEYDVEFMFDEADPENSSVRVSIGVASVETGNERRNDHLMSGDFFESDTYPFITFVSERVEQVSPTELHVTGPLKIKGQVQNVTLPVTILGVMDVAPEMQEMLGGVKKIASFQTSLTLDRRDFGVGVGSWAATAVVGSDVSIDIAVEANRK